MKNFVYSLMVIALVMVIALPAAAQKKGGKKGAARDQVSQIMARLEKLNLDADKMAEIKKLAAKCRETIAEPMKVVQPVQKALNEAKKKAEADGLKGKQAQAAVDAAVKLTDEQKKARTEIDAAIKAFRTEVGKLLTAEQKAEAGLEKKGGGKKKEG
jgi:hypothetical protein